jgi:hypothetical protein
MRALELFAGVGGASLALRAAGVRTIGYCESNPTSQAVLKHNMARRLLDEAPIYPDVALLRGEDLGGSQVDMISAGFPCLGLSVAGHHLGLRGDPRSNLVIHVLRLARELNPGYVFLENTPSIVNDAAFGTLIGQLIKLGYKCSFFVNTASEVGAKHKRARWFLLGQRKGAPPFRPSTTEGHQLKALFKQPGAAALMPSANRRNWARHICYSFGNSVVPAQAHAALVALSAALRASGAAVTPPISGKRRLQIRIPTIALGPNRFVQLRNYSPPPQGCRGEGFDVVPPSLPLHSRTRLATPALTQSFHSACFPTARTRPPCALPMPTMSKRSKDDAGNFLLSAKQMYPGGKIAGYKERLNLMVSDGFMAESFGFPRDWIRPVLVAVAKTHKQRRRTRTTRAL